MPSPINDDIGPTSDIGREKLIDGSKNCSKLSSHADPSKHSANKKELKNIAHQAEHNSNPINEQSNLNELKITIKTALLP